MEEEKLCAHKKCSRKLVVENNGNDHDNWKKCHHCATLYCSKQCRQLDWDEHKRCACIYGRLASVCKRALTHIVNDSKLRAHLSRLALDNSNSGGGGKSRRGLVWVDFKSNKEANEFLTTNARRRHMVVCEYIPVDRDLNGLLVADDDEDELQRLENLKRLVLMYEPTREFVLAASIRVLDCCKIVYKYAKIPIRLKKAATSHSMSCLSSTGSSSNNNNELEPKTLILTSLNRSGGEKVRDREPTEEDRQLFLANILNEMQLRGVNLRHAYPKVYQQLCLYVEENRPFAPVCLFPRDFNTGSLFMCLIMPKSDPVTSYPYEY